LGGGFAVAEGLWALSLKFGKWAEEVFDWPPPAPSRGDVRSMKHGKSLLWWWT